MPHLNLGIMAAAGARRRARLDRRDYRRLEQLPDFLLRDMGINRDEVRRAIRHPERYF
jgi:uncharacterized protein YjiS (DUF1127 family)